MILPKFDFPMFRGMDFYSPKYYGNTLEEIKDMINNIDITDNISFDEFNNIFQHMSYEWGFQKEFVPSRWILTSNEGNIFRFEDPHLYYVYLYSRDGRLLSIKDGYTNREITMGIILPLSMRYVIEKKIQQTIAENKQLEEWQKEQLKNEKTVKKSRVKTTRKKLSSKITKEDSEKNEFLSFLKEIQTKPFDEIYYAIVNYRIKRYNNGETTDIKCDDKSSTLSELKTKLCKNNYEKYPSLKKWVDNVIFLDNKEKEHYYKKCNIK